MAFKQKKLSPQQLDKTLREMPPIITYHRDTGPVLYPAWIHNPIIIDWEWIEYVSNNAHFGDNDILTVTSTYQELVGFNEALKPYRYLDQYIYELTIEIRLERLRLLRNYPELFTKEGETDEREWTSEGGLG